jgi:hypothetical protein
MSRQAPPKARDAQQPKRNPLATNVERVIVALSPTRRQIAVARGHLRMSGRRTS